jgi:DNA-binding GntR family transcriptional regulator
MSLTTSLTDAAPVAQADPDAGVSAARRVYLQLRQRIVDMTLVPGTRIVERDIAEELGISRTPVHEAVQRLADEGLIEVVPRSGTFVARIPLDALEEAMLVRNALEAAIIEKAAERTSAEGMARLHAILDLQAAAVEATDLRAFHRSDEMFHAALAELSGYPGVWPIILQAKTQIDRYRQLTLPLAGRLVEVLEEHRAVAAAIASGDPDRAVRAMREHLDHVLPVLEITRKLRPEYFTAHRNNPG